jgi:hypothetical protein
MLFTTSDALIFSLEKIRYLDVVKIIRKPDGSFASLQLTQSPLPLMLARLFILFTGISSQLGQQLNYP